MNYDDFMHRLINLGIDAAKADYGGKEFPRKIEHGNHVTMTGDLNADKLAGSIDGFMECRGKQPEQLGLLLEEAKKKVNEAFIRVTEKEISDGEYWRIVCWQAEIQWVANCVSVLLANQGMEPIIPFTAGAVIMVAKIVRVSAE